jgi:OOP family OmpA-OmpF porin
MNGLARAFAQARFGAEGVVMATRPGAEGLPVGWSMRVLTGLEALSRLADGSVTVTPDSIAVAGRTGRKAARDEIAARAIETLGADADLEIDVAYVEELDPLAALPTPEECLAKITAVTDAAKITFDPGSDTISREGMPVIEAIAEILRSCPDLRLRIAGYTDSQGGEASNLQLSQSRAEAVLSALRTQRVPVAGFEALGYGEASPIASNDTEAGRVANRRIEFTLLGEEAPTVAADFIGPPRPPVHDAAAQPMADAPEAPPLRPDGEEAAQE